jgi:hypothetical protein
MSIFRRDPSVVFVVVALLMGAAAIGLAFPITWSLRTKQMPPPATRDGPSRAEDEDDLPWMPGGDIFGGAADDGADRGSQRSRAASWSGHGRPATTLAAMYESPRPDDLGDQRTRLDAQAEDSDSEADPAASRV